MIKMPKQVEDYKKVNIVNLFYFQSCDPSEVEFECQANFQRFFVLYFDQSRIIKEVFHG
jgi:hypothetical protein